MPRRLLHPTDPQEVAQRELEVFLRRGRRQQLHDGAPTQAAIARSQANKDRAVMRVMMQKGKWTGATGGVLVALYEWCHREVYGVAPAELKTAWLAAAAEADKLIAEEFDKRAARAVDFVRWVWARERQRRARDADAESGFRIGWRFQFKSRTMVTDWRMATIDEKHAS